MGLFKKLNAEGLCTIVQAHALDEKTTALTRTQDHPVCATEFGWI
jgi:hypothetical protein